MTRKRKRSARAQQLDLAFKSWGGARRGAGRKPEGSRALVSHARRPALHRSAPLLVTWKLCPGRASLRRAAEANAVMNALLLGKDRFCCRVVHFSIQRDHLHLLVEAADAPALSRAMKGLGVRIARALQRLWGSKGTVFKDRYHARALGTPREVRHALAYVLCNTNKHHGPRTNVDWASSGRWFDGWRTGLAALPKGLPIPVAIARTWLVRVGWRRHGLIEPSEWPGKKRGRQSTKRSKNVRALEGANGEPTPHRSHRATRSQRDLKPLPAKNPGASERNSPEAQAPASVSAIRGPVGRARDDLPVSL